MRIFNLFFMILFVLSAALQYNDPDPYLWMPLYLYGALVCWKGYKRTLNKNLLLPGLIIYVVYAAYLLIADNGMLDWLNQHDAENIAQSMKATKPWIEQTREFFGLVILILVFSVNGAVLKRKPSSI